MDLLACHAHGILEAFNSAGGEAGIRTLGGGSPLNGFQDRHFKPLSHLSVSRHLTKTPMNKSSTLIPFFTDNKGVYANILGFACNSSLSLLINLIIIQRYDVLALGLWGIVSSMAWLLSQVTVLGMHAMILRHCSYYKHQEQQVSDLLYRAFFICTATSLSVGSLAVLFWPYYGALYLPSTLTAVEKTTYSLIFYAGLILFSFNKISISAINALESPKRFAQLNSSRYCINFITVLLLTRFKISSLWLPILSFFLTEISLILIYFRVLTKNHLKKIRPMHLKDFSNDFFFGLKSIFNSLYSELNSKILLLLLGLCTNIQTVGLYNFMALFLEGYYQLCLTIRHVINPKVPLLYQKRKSFLKAVIKTTVKKTYLTLFWVVCMNVCFVFILSGWMLKPEHLSLTRQAFLLASIGYYLGSGGIALDGILSQLNRPFEQTLLNVIAVFILIWATLYWIPTFGLLAVSWAMILSALFIVFYTGLILKCVL